MFPQTVCIHQPKLVGRSVGRGTRGIRENWLVTKISSVTTYELSSSSAPTSKGSTVSEERDLPSAFRGRGSSTRGRIPCIFKIQPPRCASLPCQGGSSVETVSWHSMVVSNLVRVGGIRPALVSDTLEVSGT